MSQASYVVQPSSPGVAHTLWEVWEARRLLAIFVWRDLKVRYKHTFLGAAWNIIQPLGMMAVYTFVFGVVFTGRLGEVDYPIFLFPAILLWQLFSKSIMSGGESLATFGGVIGKVYFPRMIAPASAVAATLFDLMVASVALVVLMFLYDTWPDWHIVFAPVFLLVTLCLALGFALWLSALDANYKDIRHALTFLTQFWMFATPVMYPLSLVPERYHLWYGLNPMVGLIQGFRWSLVPGTTAPTLEMLVPSGMLAIAILISGSRYFMARDGTFVDTL